MHILYLHSYIHIFGVRVSGKSKLGSNFFEPKLYLAYTFSKALQVYYCLTKASLHLLCSEIRFNLLEYCNGTPAVSRDKCFL